MRNKTNLCLRERFPAQLLIALVVSIAVPPSFILPCTVVFIESVSKNSPNEKNLEGDQGSPKSKQRQQCCHVCHMAHRYQLNIVTNVRHCLPHTRSSHLSLCPLFCYSPVQFTIYIIHIRMCMWTHTHTHAHFATHTHTHTHTHTRTVFYEIYSPKDLTTPPPQPPLVAPNAYSSWYTSSSSS